MKERYIQSGFFIKSSSCVLKKVICPVKYFNLCYDSKNILYYNVYRDVRELQLRIQSEILASLQTAFGSLLETE